MRRDRDAPARLTDPDHLGHHPVWIGDHGDNMKRRDVVETVVGKVEIQRVAQAELDMTPAVLSDAFLCACASMASEGSIATKCA